MKIIPSRPPRTISPGRQVAPRIRMTDVSLDRGSDEVTLELTGRCEGTTSGADEILLMFG